MSSILVEKVSNTLSKRYSRSGRYTTRLCFSYVLADISGELRKVFADKEQKTEQTVLLANLEVVNLVKLQELAAI